MRLKKRVSYALCLLEEELNGPVRPLENSSDDESEDGTDFLALAEFPVPDEPSSEEESLRDGPAGGRATHDHVHGSRLVY